jgi:hypothetical protein
LKKFTVSIGASLLLAACASPQPTAIRDTVGPQPPGLRPQVGFLQVYSATEQHSDGDNTYRYPHTGYEICANDGRPFKQVRNAITTSDETPERVTLPKGRYIIAALSETFGPVRVPVVIRTGSTTEVHLERQKDWTAPALARQSDFVRLPNGQPIGFRSAKGD